MIGRELRIMSPEWVRGRAHYEDGWIVIDEPTPYAIFGEKGIVFDLARILDYHDAVEFAERYGMLFAGPNETEYRERFDSWQDAAETLRSILYLHMTLGEAISGNDAAIAKLWEFEPTSIRPFFAVAAANDHELLSQASGIVAAAISEGLRGVEQSVFSTVEFEGGQPGQYALGAEPSSLVGVAYHELAMLVVNRVPLRLCEECGRAFPVRDQRQRYCGPKCSNRARYQRWQDKAKQREPSTS